MNAAGGGHSDVVKWLLTEVGEGRSGTKAMNYTMSAAVANGDVELVRWLQDEKGIPLPRCGAFYEAAAKGCLAMLQSYFTQAANGTGVLLRAAESGHLDIVRWVINREIEGGVCPKTNGEGANKNALTSLGGEASLSIHVAAVNGHVEVAKYLLEHVDCCPRD
ncbi:hypothetical protein PHYSODRAFT_297425 [Phytophthora sojae]|uniref:Uncharacterized protein n=1 Tax=Phytophthora sojae (strain P6497) TaxID=1094619 RepID=G4YUS8_PHYSP|nr:hypothetical protein PHYSODRAFT_297425 [Phytophthora sojae]EGZ26003.1 hypothetical protein PHYSODRAFT_297425 [Phytophthora sojae]|eukprot:XP_009521291.1 hypothetical protein PHYSODRAFT_297425 [Phytophthora sojae]